MKKWKEKEKNSLIKCKICGVLKKRGMLAGSVPKGNLQVFSLAFFLILSIV